MLFFDYAKIEIWAEMAVQICHKDVQICHNADKQGYSSHAFYFFSLDVSLYSDGVIP